MKNRVATPDALTDEPFVGPGPFEERQESLFFGRGFEIDELISLVWAHPVVLLYAPSGSGKSSLLNAALIPTLRRRGFHVLPSIRVHPDAVMEELAGVPNRYVAALMSSLATSREADVVATGASPSTIAEMLDGIEREADEFGDPRMRLMVLDQFEEILTPFETKAGSDATYLDHQRVFFAQISEAMAGDSRLRLVFAIREDNLGEVERLGLGLPRGFRTRYRMDFLQPVAARSAILGPTRGQVPGDGRPDRPSLPPHFDENLADDLVNQLVQTPKVAGLPSYFVEPAELQVVCRGCWHVARTRQGGPAVTDDAEVTSQDLVEIGGVEGALRRHYDNAVLDAVERWRHDAWAIHEGDEKEQLPPRHNERHAWRRKLPWSRHAALERRLRAFFGKELISHPAETRRLVSTGDSKNKINPKVLEWLQANWRILRQEQRRGVAYWELSQDGFVKPILASNLKNDSRTRDLYAGLAALGMVLVALVIAVLIATGGDNSIREIAVVSVEDQEGDKVRLYDDDPVKGERWETSEERVKLVVELKEEVELVAVYFEPGVDGFVPQTVLLLLGEGVGKENELSVGARPDPDATVETAYCCGKTLTLIIERPPSETLISIGEIEIWGRSPTTSE